jgi:hypothetical protein
MPSRFALCSIGVMPRVTIRSDFANAFPFSSRKKEKDPTRTVVLAAAALAFLAFLGSMIAVFMMRGPLP